jgi:DNA-binding CsgD family transcriptional regulator
MSSANNSRNLLRLLSQGARIRAESERLVSECRLLEVSCWQLLCESKRLRQQNSFSRESQIGWLSMIPETAAAANNQTERQVPRPAADPEPIPDAAVGTERTRRPDRLTRRECEVLKWIAEGRSTKQVAGILGIAVKTTSCHRYRAMEKLGIHDTATLVRYAVRHRLVPV